MKTKNKNAGLKLVVNDELLTKVELNNQDKKRYVGVYIHIPFCNSKCYYCNFNSYVVKNSERSKVFSDYLVALKKEISSYSLKLKDKVVNTVFIGGGTPSIMTNGGIKEIIEQIKSSFNVSSDVEITMEINPNAFSQSDALEWCNAGVNRVSVGLQTANEKILKSINRTHSVKDFLTTMQTLKSVGFKSINADMILGLPNQKLKDIKQTLKLILKQKVNHVSAYGLMLEEDSVLNKLITQNKLALPSEDDTIKMYDYVYKRLKKHNINRYEVSNFSKSGYECKHNVNCWNMYEYIGFGAGAHSYFDNKRFSNVLPVHEYIDKINDNYNANDFVENISKNEELEETILLGLRLQNGIDLLSIKQNFDIDLLKDKKTIIVNYIKNDFLTLNNNYLSLTEKGFYVVNKIILELVY